MSLPDDIVREIKRTKPKPTKTRASHGQWVEPAKAALALVNNDGWTVTEAVNEVVFRLNLHPADRAFTAIRAAYYEAKNRQKP